MDPVNFWWAMQTCIGGVQLLTEKWTSIVYNITNVHEWDGGEGGVFNKCVHLTATETLIMAKLNARLS